MLIVDKLLRDFTGNVGLKQVPVLRPKQGKYGFAKSGHRSNIALFQLDKSGDDHTESGLRFVGG